MNITIEKIPENQLKPLYQDPSQLGFGKVFTDYMFTMNYYKGKGWVRAENRQICSDEYWACPRWYYIITGDF